MSLDGGGERSRHHTRVENCAVCETDRRHYVWIELVEEGRRNHESARKPARMSECSVCGHTVRNFSLRRRPAETVREGRKVEKSGE